MLNGETFAKDSWNLHRSVPPDREPSGWPPAAFQLRAEITVSLRPGPSTLPTPALLGSPLLNT